MLSYKQWKMLNESFAGPITLGLAQPTNLGFGSPSGFGMPLEEEKAKAMKKSKKKMFGGDDELVKGKMPKHAHAHPDVDVDVEGGDDEMGDDEMGGGGDDMGMGDDEQGDACGRMCAKKSKKKMMKSKKKMWSDADDDAGEASEDDEGGDDEGEASEDDEGGDDEGDEGGDDEGGDDEGMDATMDKKAPVPMMSKKGSKKKMKKEAFLDDEQEWMASVKNMLDPSSSTRKYDDGFSRYYEDALFTPVDMNNLTQAVRNEPGEPTPGQPGFAPQTRIGQF